MERGEFSRTLHSSSSAGRGVSVQGAAQMSVTRGHFIAHRGATSEVEPRRYSQPNFRHCSLHRASADKSPEVEPPELQGQQLTLILGSEHRWLQWHRDRAEQAQGWMKDKAWTSASCKLKKNPTTTKKKWQFNSPDVIYAWYLVT